MLKAAEIGVGDIAKVQIEFDPVSREIAMHPDTGGSSEAFREAKACYDALAEVA
jgi:hypothetical protein